MRKQHEYTLRELAQMAGVHWDNLRYWIDKKKLPVERVNGKYFYMPPKALAKFLSIVRSPDFFYMVAPGRILYPISKMAQLCGVAFGTLHTAIAKGIVPAPAEGIGKRTCYRADQVPEISAALDGRTKAPGNQLSDTAFQAEGLYSIKRATAAWGKGKSTCCVYWRIDKGELPRPGTLWRGDYYYTTEQIEQYRHLFTQSQ